MTLILTNIRQYAHLVMVLLSATAGVAAYWQALDYPFLSDDLTYLPENTKLIRLPLAELWRLFTEPYNCCFEFLPLRDFSYWLDMALFGMTPQASRLHNILLYLLCLPLVYGVTSGLWRYFRPADTASAPWAAAAVTALFALHPALVESVVWISGRKYILPNLFSLLALWFAVSARRERGLAAPHAAAALVAFAAMMLSKSSYVAVAPVIALLWLLFWRDVPAPDRRRSQLLWPLALLLLAGLMTLNFIAHNKGYDGMPFYFGLEAVTRTLAVLGWLARLAITPESRHFIYPVFEDPYLPVMVALGVAVLAAAVTGAAMLLRGRSLEGFALVAFLLFCAPYMELIPHKSPSLVADRYVALAIWPTVLLLVALAWRLKPVPRAVLLLAVALPWGFQTIERPRDWRSQEEQTNSDFRAYPWHYYIASEKIIFVLLPQGLYNEARAATNAITDPEFRSVTEKVIQVDYAVHFNSGSLNERREAMARLFDLGAILDNPPVQAKWDPSAIYVWRGLKNRILASEWKMLAERFHEDATVRYNAGLWMLVNHKSKDAVAHLRAATESPQLQESVRGTAFKNLGLALLNSGHIVDAEAPLHSALEQSPPDLRAYCLLSKVYKQTKRFEEAARADAGCPGRTPNEEAAR